MAEEVLCNFFSKGPEFKSQLGRVFFIREKPFFKMNLGQDLNYLAETHLSDIL